MLFLSWCRFQCARRRRWRWAAAGASSWIERSSEVPGARGVPRLQAPQRPDQARPLAAQTLVEACELMAAGAGQLPGSRVKITDQGDGQNQAPDINLGRRILSC